MKRSGLDEKQIIRILKAHGGLLGTAGLKAWSSGRGTSSAKVRSPSVSAIAVPGKFVRRLDTKPHNEMGGGPHSGPPAQIATPDKKNLVGADDPRRQRHSSVCKRAKAACT
jgi:hypothetical protein